MKNPLDMQGKVVLVTGASTGLGQGVALLLAELGAKVVLCSRDAVRLEEMRSRLKVGGHAVEAFDLSNTDAITPWLKGVAERQGPLTGLVHSAGILPTKPLRMQSAIDWDAAIRINVTAAAALAKGFRQRGVYAGTGSIVFISSVMGLVGQPGQILYSATKGALVAMARSMALELAREEIRVNCVAPGVVLAGMTEHLRNMVTPESFEQIGKLHPLGLGRAEDVANAVAFLLADTGRWITGTTLVVDGGYTAQ